MSPLWRRGKSMGLQPGEGCRIFFHLKNVMENEKGIYRATTGTHLEAQSKVKVEKKKKWHFHFL